MTNIKITQEWSEQPEENFVHLGNVTLNQEEEAELESRVLKKLRGKIVEEIPMDERRRLVQECFIEMLAEKKGGKE